eukprot:scaffold198060_cov32-Tisochrysis_lutea.AAC.1
MTACSRGIDAICPWRRPHDHVPIASCHANEDARISEVISALHAAISQSAAVSCKPPAVDAFVPMMQAVAIVERDVEVGIGVSRGLLMLSRCSESCRAVGWSNMSVVGSACVDWDLRRFPSSTAPSESSPDSINGASGSTISPTVRLIKSNMKTRSKFCTTVEQSLPGLPNAVPGAFGFKLWSSFEDSL